MVSPALNQGRHLKSVGKPSHIHAEHQCFCSKFMQKSGALKSVTTSWQHQTMQKMSEVFFKDSAHPHMWCSSGRPATAPTGAKTNQEDISHVCTYPQEVEHVHIFWMKDCISSSIFSTSCQPQKYLTSSGSAIQLNWDCWLGCLPLCGHQARQHNWNHLQLWSTSGPNSQILIWEAGPYGHIVFCCGPGFRKIISLTLCFVLICGSLLCPSARVPACCSWGKRRGKLPEILTTNIK